MKKFTSLSPVGYADHSIDIINDGIQLIQDMLQNEDDEASISMLKKDLERFERAKETLYEIIRDT